MSIQRTTLAASAMAAAFAASLYAQTEPVVTDAAENTVEIPETIVTGTLWESDLQKTTASITVIDENRLKSSGTQHFGDLVNAIPNLTWTGGSSRPRYIQIRGIGENSQFEGETPDSSVRFMIDDLDFTGLGTIGNLFDTKQVEVLRGPQAGAFGVNAAGGVVQIVTNDPTPYWTGQVEGTAGDDSLFAGGVAVGGPLLKNDPEQLTFRFSAYQLQQDGFRDNKFLGKDDTNERDELNTRLKLRWIANEDWEWNATLFYADVDNGYDEWSLNNTEFDTFSDEPGRDEQESFAASIRGTWTGLNQVDVTTITSYISSESLYSYDNDWTSGDYDSIPVGTYDGFIENDRDRDVFTQELRFDSTDQQDALGWIDRWTTGFYFNHLEEDTITDYEDYGGFAHADYQYETDSFSVYGQGAHDFSPETRLIIGLRYEYHEVDIKTKNVDDGGPWYDGSLSDEDSDQSSSLWGGKITLEHDLTTEQMLFTSFARGYKAGGANGGVFRKDEDPLTYDDETLYNFEAGLRSEWFDAALTTQVTAFYLYREDAQLRDS
ncbi:MAG: TonB-dependent receptor, partial [Coraliomargarita sp.]